jgi:hypothetical protein
MKKVMLFFLLLLFFGCTGDDSIELGGGYFLRLEGPGTNDILNHNGNLREIPPNVIS